MKGSWVQALEAPGGPYEDTGETQPPQGWAWHTVHLALGSSVCPPEHSLFQLVSHKIHIQKSLFFSTTFSFFQKKEHIKN